MANKKLVLGTVQLGMQYGISNTTGKPDEASAMSILDTALEAGIDMFDTAAAYGDSEQVLGRWITSRSISGRVRILSKLSPSPGRNAENVKSEILNTLRRLNIEKLDGYLLHSAADMESEAVMSGMLAAKKAGHILNIGVSIYEPKQGMRAIEHGLDYIQVPYNAFDRRLDASGFFDVAKKNGAKVFARSAFLQGLLLMEPAAVPQGLSQASQLIKRFRDIATGHGLTPLQAALSYACNHPGIDYVVFGVETKAQLEEILAVDTKEHEPCVAELRDAFTEVDSIIIDPRLWPKKD